MRQSDSLAIVLAAGKGTRMGQSIPKPLVLVNHKPIISWIVNSFSANNVDVVAVINPKSENLFKPFNKMMKFVFQKEQNGTGHAVMQATDIILKYKYVYVFVGDSPFIGSEVVSSMYHQHLDEDSDITILSSIFKGKKFPYARVIRDKDANIVKVVEEIDANEQEVEIDELFGSHYLFKSEVLFDYLFRLKKNNKTGEIYFTDILNELIADNNKINSMVIADWRKLVGLNTMEDVKWAESQKII